MLGNITVLQIENIRKITYLDVKLDEKGKIIKVIGPNDAGKSTLLDAIRFAFEGGEIPDDVITHGHEKGTIRIETSSGWVITKKIRKNKKGEQVSELIVRNKDKFKEKAQTFLKELSSKFIDPSRLIDLTEHELTKAIFEIYKLDFEQIDKELEETKLNLKVLRKQIKELGAEPENPEIPISNIDDVTDRFLKVSEDKIKLENEREKLETNINTDTQLIADNQKRIQELLKTINDLEEENQMLSTSIQDYKKKLDMITEQQKENEKTYSILSKQMEIVKTHKELIERKKIHDEWVNKKEYLDKSYTQLSEKQKELINKKKEVVKNLNLPIDIREDGIFYNEDRWGNLSTSTKLTIATNLAINAIPENGLKVLYMQRGESIGEEKLKLLAKLAKEHNVQIFLEVFKESDNDGIIIKGVEDEEDFTNTAIDNDIDDDFNLF